MPPKPKPKSASKSRKTPTRKTSGTKARATSGSPPSPYDGYASPLAGRYASPEMQSIWSARRKFATWRRIWLAVAEAQQACGLPISDQQIKDLRTHLDVTDAEIRAAERYERELRHDVMSHVHALGDVCKKARPIIHLGMTSQDVNDNTELLLLSRAVMLIHEKAMSLVLALGAQARRWRDLPTLGLTHFQPAQPTTVGRRIASWASDLVLSGRGLTDVFGWHFELRGFKGATGTQASYLALFDGDAKMVTRFEALALWNLREAFNLEFEPGESLDDHIRIERSLDETVDSGALQELRELIGEALDIEPGQFSVQHEEHYDEGVYVQQRTFPLSAQTYPRVLDALVLGSLSAIASVLHKMATDIRLLCGRGELDEPFGESQVGSSAMPHKRNPMKCERVCGLARFVMNLAANAPATAATQWLERTLDDSANRRLTLPEAFLALDGCLDLMRTVIEGLEVHEPVVQRNLEAQLPFLASENLLMQAVKLGRDRQDVHEAIRKHAQAAAKRMKTEGADNDLIARLKRDPLLKRVDFTRAMDPMAHVGLAREQVDAFLSTIVEPMRASLDESTPPSDRGV